MSLTEKVFSMLTGRNLAADRLRELYESHQKPVEMLLRDRADPRDNFHPSLTLASDAASRYHKEKGLDEKVYNNSDTSRKTVYGRAFENIKDSLYNVFNKYLRPPQGGAELELCSAGCYR